MCFVPRKLASNLTHGFVTPDLEYPPATIVLWGVNLAETGHHDYRRVIEAASQGAKLVVIDPRKTLAANNADLWVKPRPGSDLALALGMINVIVNERLYDKAFVERWTTGFAEIKAHVQDYPPERVADTTWIPAEMIRQAARIYASNKPACIVWGNAIDHGVNSFQTARAICILRGITGNLEVPGGELRWIDPPILRRGAPELSLPEMIPLETRQRRITTEEKLLPIYFSALPQGIVKAILHGDPYPIKAAYIQACNPLLIYSNAKQVYRALLNLDFFAAADMFMTPTAALADIVLPVSTYLEYDGIVVPCDHPIALLQQKVIRVHECRSDYEILRDIAGKIGLGKYFWDTEEKCLDFIMAPSGLSFNEFMDIGELSASKEYRTYKSLGFPTPSGKVELYSKQLANWGFDPLPIHKEPPETPYSNPELSDEFPLVLTSWKSAEYRHSEGRQIASLRQSHREPVAQLHEKTAAKLGISEGDWIFIETKRGRIEQKAILSSDIDPKVIAVDYGWWFPEENSTNLYSWDKSNVNILTDDQQPFSQEMGSPNLRGIMCKVCKVPGEAPGIK
jgi:anaerobic selenocysteine-containing dehydrogenase